MLDRIMRASFSNGLFSFSALFEGEGSSLYDYPVLQSDLGCSRQPGKHVGSDR